MLVENPLSRCLNKDERACFMIKVGSLHICVDNFLSFSRLVRYDLYTIHIELVVLKDVEWKTWKRGFNLMHCGLFRVDCLLILSVVHGFVHIVHSCGKLITFSTNYPHSKVVENCGKLEVIHFIQGFYLNVNVERIFTLDNSFKWACLFVIMC